MCDFTIDTSDALMAPAAFTSARKLVALIGWPIRDFVRAISDALTSVPVHIASKCAHRNDEIADTIDAKKRYIDCLGVCYIGTVTTLPLMNTIPPLLIPSLPTVPIPDVTAA